MHADELDAILTEGRRCLFGHKWYYSGMGVLNGLPRGVATIMWGNPNLPEWALEAGAEPRYSINVAVPLIPEFRQMRQLEFPGSENYGKAKPHQNVDCYGWREILRKLVLSGRLRRDNGSVRHWLGEHEYEDLRRQTYGAESYGIVKTQHDKLHVASHDGALRQRAARPTPRGEFL